MGIGPAKNKTPSSKRARTFLLLAVNYLREFNPVLRLPSRNPGVKSRGEFINEIFAGNVPEASILIGDQCNNTVADYLYLKEDADGLKFKEKTTDKATKYVLRSMGIVL